MEAESTLPAATRAMYAAMEPRTVARPTAVSPTTIQDYLPAFTVDMSGEASLPKTLLEMRRWLADRIGQLAVFVAPRRHKKVEHSQFYNEWVRHLEPAQIPLFSQRLDEYARLVYAVQTPLLHRAFTNYQNQPDQRDILETGLGLQFRDETKQWARTVQVEQTLFGRGDKTAQKDLALSTTTHDTLPFVALLNTILLSDTQAQEVPPLNIDNADSVMYFVTTQIATIDATLIRLQTLTPSDIATLGEKFAQIKPALEKIFGQAIDTHLPLGAYLCEALQRVRADVVLRDETIAALHFGQDAQQPIVARPRRRRGPGPVTVVRTNN